MAWQEKFSLCRVSRETGREVIDTGRHGLASAFGLVRLMPAWRLVSCAPDTGRLARRKNYERRGRLE
jgi:hypothetical protein